jgi:hypothetical protein
MKIIFIIAFLFLGFSQSSVVVTDITATGDIDSQLCNASLCSLKNEFNCMKGSIDTLYVDQGYNCTDGIHFNTISAAMVKAATLVPTADNLVTILINPGTYTENVQVVSNTVMQGIYQSTFICGDVTWFASVGVNVMYSTQDEYIFMNNLILASDQNYDVVCGSLIISTVDKTDMSSYTEAILVLVFVLDITSVTMRNSDELEFQSCEFFDTVSLYNVGVTLFTDTSFDNVYFLAGTIGVVQNCYFNSIYVQDSPFTELYFAIVLENATFINSIITASQSIFNDVIATSSTQASILGCTYKQLFGDNTTQVDRDLSTFTMTPTSRGENTFTFPIAYINAPSYIGFTQKNSFTYQPAILNISNTDFVYTITGGGTYIVTVQNYLAQDVLI